MILHPSRPDGGHGGTNSGILSNDAVLNPSHPSPTSDANITRSLIISLLPIPPRLPWKVTSCKLAVLGKRDKRMREQY